MSVIQISIYIVSCVLVRVIIGHSLKREVLTETEIIVRDLFTFIPFLNTAILLIHILSLIFKEKK